MKIHSHLKWTGTILLLATIAAGFGCQTQGGASGPLASVAISNQSLANVQKTIASVFARHGFLGGQSGANEFTYTRIGANPVGGPNSFNDIARVKAVVTTLPSTNDTITVACNAWLLDTGMNPALQGRQPTPSIRRWPYQQLLNEVKTDLGQ
jgi:hypothetical protein